MTVKETKIVPFPIQMPVEREPNALWFISVGSTYSEHCTCKYSDKDGYWVVDVKAKTLAGAIALARVRLANVRLWLSCGSMATPWSEAAHNLMGNGLTSMGLMVFTWK